MPYTALMKRTQVYFDEDDWARIQARASRGGRSAASVVRDAVTAYLAADAPDEDPIITLIREAESLVSESTPPSDSALEHDHYLYGWPKEGQPWLERND